jgi:hypothetical protein
VRWTPDARRDDAFLQRPRPIPLLGQLQQRYGEKVTITYQQREPGAIVIDFAKVG